MKDDRVYDSSRGQYCFPTVGGPREQNLPGVTLKTLLEASTQHNLYLLARLHWSTSFFQLFCFTSRTSTKSKLFKQGNTDYSVIVVPYLHGLQALSDGF